MSVLHPESVGSPEAFDDDWVQALTTGHPRWFSYPSEPPATQTDLFEWVKAKRIKRLLSARGIRQGRVLEFGCGSAGMSVFLANLGFEVWATDLSLNALHVARINACSHGSPGGLQLMRSDAFHLPFRSGAFDVVMSHGLLEHFDESALQALVPEVVRVLRASGLFISDIVPGPQRFTARTLGLVASYLGSFLYHLVTGRLGRLGRLHRDYFGGYFENDLDEREWKQLLEKTGLCEVAVEVCRPFPPLAVAGAMERLYVKLMLGAMPLWQRFDGSNTWFSRHWGWMYLAHGTRAN